MRASRWKLGLVAATVLAILIPGTAAQATQTQTAAVAPTAARSTVVYIKNTTDCTLERTWATLSHGVWWKYPPAVIPGNTTVSFGSESNGFMTGTEGSATFMVTFCPELGPGPGSNLGSVGFEWDNPYVGSNSYQVTNTTWDWHLQAPAEIKILKVSGGSGNNAVIVYQLS
jgi:hypothetical protein